MQGYQTHSQAIHHGCALISLTTTTTMHNHRRYVVGRAEPAVPGSPGHATNLLPYPPGRFRRRNS